MRGVVFQAVGTNGTRGTVKWAFLKGYVDKQMKFSGSADTEKGGKA